MGELIQTVLTVIGTSGATAFGAWLLFRGKRVDQEVEETKVEATATTAFLEGQLAFQEYVDKVVEKRVEAELTDVRAQMAGFATELADVKRESHEMNDAIRSRETQLWLWDNHYGRQGPIPALPEPILKRLGIGHLALAAAASGHDEPPIGSA